MQSNMDLKEIDNSEKLLRNAVKNADITENDVSLLKALEFWQSNYSFMLTPEVIIIVGINEGKICNLTSVEIMKHLIYLNLTDELEAFNPLTNFNFHYIRFKNAKAVIKFMNATTRINNINVHFLSSKTPDKFINILIDRIPASVLREFLPKVLNKFGQIQEIIPNYIKGLKNNLVETTPTNIKFKMQENLTIEDLPYFVFILNVKTHLNIRGRKPACYRCNATDHVVNFCPKKYCSTCKCLKDKMHQCIITYASTSKFKINSMQNIFNIIEDQHISQDLNEDVNDIATVVKSINISPPVKNINLEELQINEDVLTNELVIDSSENKQDNVLFSEDDNNIDMSVKVKQNNNSRKGKGKRKADLNIDNISNNDQTLKASKIRPQRNNKIQQMELNLYEDLNSQDMKSD